MFSSMVDDYSLSELPIVCRVKFDQLRLCRVRISLHSRWVQFTFSLHPIVQGLQGLFIHMINLIMSTFDSGYALRVARARKIAALRRH